MAQPALTIDFLGLCAFVTDSADPGRAKHLTVLFLDAQQILPEEGLCRHDSLLVFKGKDFSVAGQETPHYSYHSLEREDVGVWHLRGFHLCLKDTPADQELMFLSSYNKILRMDQLVPSHGTIDSVWSDDDHYPGVSGSLEISSGRIEGLRWSERWRLAPRTAEDGRVIRFLQGVRWTVPNITTLRPQLFAGDEEWIEFQRGSHLILTNLCPLTPRTMGPALDVLTYYELSTETVPSADRYVLHPIDAAQGNEGVPVRPGVDACPPITAYLERDL